MSEEKQIGFLCRMSKWDIESIIYICSFPIGVCVIALMIGCCQEDGEKATNFYNYQGIIKNWLDSDVSFLFKSTW
jgi:hypothetical protein